MKTWTRAIAAQVCILAALLVAGVGTAEAQALDPGVAVMNEHMHVLKVYAVDADQERHLLGMVGADELEFFRIPAAARSADGYRIGVQPVTPLPQIGVPADPHPFVATPLISPGPDEMVQVVVAQDLDLSSAIIP